MERRLTTILSYDVVGYSRAMGVDEVGTLHRLKAHRRRVIEPQAAQHGGRIIKLVGDGALMEFASVIDAVVFAVRMQFGIAQLNSELTESQRLLYRIGINVGDVIVDGDDIYGDGVNVAARIESLADPGGICIRRNVRNQIRGKLSLNFHDLGEIEAKNIDRPLRAFKVMMDEKAAALAEAPVARSRARKPRRMLRVGTVALALAIAVGLGWWRPWLPDFDPAAPRNMGYRLPDRPSIAVLPFENLSGDPEQEYFAEGMTEDLITDLSKVSGLFVIARNSTAAYDGKQVDAREVGRDLGVRYLLRGSVRRSGEQLRINAQLIDAANGGHVWADRLDGPANEVLALQDRIATRIVSTLEVELSEEEQDRIFREETTRADAHDRFLRGYQLFQRFTPDANAAAQSEFRTALEIDPGYAKAEALLGWTYWMATVSGWGDAPLKVALGHADRALALDGALGTAYALRGKVYLWQGRHDDAAAELRRAIEVEPSYAYAYAHLGDVLFWSGEPEEALAALEQGLRISPNDSGWILTLICLAHSSAGRHEAAIAAADRALARNPEYFWAHVCRGAVLGEMGRESEARAAVSRAREINPRFSLAFFETMAPFRRDQDRRRYTEALRSAGLTG